MNKYLGKLLRRHISIGQFVGFFFANLFGMVIVLLGIQFYTDIKPLFTQADSFMKKDFIIVTKKMSTLSNLAGKSSVFSPKELEALKEQPFTQQIAGFTSSQFNVSAGISMEGTGMQMSTAMFFESVPDAFIDVATDKWHFDENSPTIPIIIPRNYLNLYNFGFAQSRNLPKLSEGVMGMITLNIVLRGNGATKQLKGNIVGFSSRLNTILVPQSFMDWANYTFAPGTEARPARVILETNNPADAAIAKYFQQRGYETEDNKLDAGKTSYFLNLIVGIILVVGLVISLLSFYILMLSIFLLLQKNSTKLENLLLIGYSPRQVATPYRLLAVCLNFVVLCIALIAVFVIQKGYLDVLLTLSPQMPSSFPLAAIICGALLFVLVSTINIVIIERKVKRLFYNRSA